MRTDPSETPSSRIVQTTKVAKEISVKNLKAIEETKYLTTSNSAQYRQIMRIFFNAYEKTQFRLQKEDVFEIIKTYEGFEDYSMEQLKLDLQTLEEWKNLTKIQSYKTVHSIEEYKNMQFRYSMSKYAVEVERLTIKLENLPMESAGVSSNFFNRIYMSIENIETISNQSPKEVSQWWYHLQEDFKFLNQTYQDYLGEFYSGKSEKTLKTIEFVLYKDKFISYLKDFIKQLQVDCSSIEEMLKNVSDTTRTRILEQTIVGEMEVPRPTVTDRNVLEQNIRERVYGRWEALTNWFVNSPINVSESNRLLEITDDIIRKIIQNASMIVRLQNWGFSRKDDYKKFAEMFSRCDTIEEANKLSAYVFGIHQTNHYIMNEERTTDSINSSTYEEDPMEFTLKSRTKEYKPLVEKTGFVDKSIEKIEQNKSHIHRQEQERQLVFKYIVDNKLDVSTIKDCIDQSTRMTILRWISLANLNISKMGFTEYGQAYQLIKKDGLCTLRCVDGELIMPIYILEFKEETHG